MTAHPEKDPAPVPETIGRYRILERVARDWMDDVYRAFDPMLERPVVVKTFKLPAEDAVPTSHGAIKRSFYEEMRRTGALLHPGIATLFDAGELPGGLFMASELVEGPTLAELCASANLDLPLRLSLLAQVVDALEYARGQGVAHLNLTPTHVLVPRGTGIEYVDAKPGDVIAIMDDRVRVVRRRREVP